MLVWIVTRHLTVSFALGGVELVSKIGLYWLHERIWEQVGHRALPKPGVVVWLTGLSGSGKSTLASWLAGELTRAGHRVEHLDGDAVREVFPDTGFSREARNAHVRRMGYVAARLAHHGVTVLASFISPYEDGRRQARAMCETFVEVYLSTPLPECERRDVKGLYASARRGNLLHFTGIDDPYEVPHAPDLTIDTRWLRVDEAGALVLDHVRRLQKPGRQADESLGRTRSKERLYPPGGLREFPATGDAVVGGQG